jgi:hypothetical protein
MSRRPVFGVLAIATIGVVLASVAGCSSSDTTVSGPAVADVSMDLVPTSGPTEVSTDPDHDWMVSMDLVLTESGGKVGADINQVSVALVEAQNGISVGAQDGDGWRLLIDAPANRVEAGETLTLGLDVFYTFESRGRESLVDVTVVIVDDNGTVLRGTERFHGLP